MSKLQAPSFTARTEFQRAWSTADFDQSRTTLVVSKQRIGIWCPNVRRSQ
jgi:hypothetical protein